MAIRIADTQKLKKIPKRNEKYRIFNGNAIVLSMQEDLVVFYYQGHDRRKKFVYNSRNFLEVSYEIKPQRKHEI